MTIGEVIRKYREQAGMSQNKLAKLMPGWHQMTTTRVESDVRPLRLHEAVQLSALLRFDLAELVALIPTVDTCPTCWGDPVDGFTCNTCGRSA